LAEPAAEINMILDFSLMTYQLSRYSLSIYSIYSKSLKLLFLESPANDERDGYKKSMERGRGLKIN